MEVKTKIYSRKKLGNQKEFVTLYHLMHLPEGEAQFFKTTSCRKMFFLSYSFPMILLLALSINCVSNEDR